MLSLTGALLLITREIVAGETPAWRATSNKVGLDLSRLTAAFSKENENQ
jgi:hypothetical protein